MKQYLKIDEWNILEEGFQADNLRMSESIFSLGNGHFGERGNFEEPYSSDSYRASFVAGMAFMDKTRVGWWKNGYPLFGTRVPIAADWRSIRLRLIDEELDPALWSVNSFNRRLDMKAGLTRREMEVTSPHGHRLYIDVTHVDHIARPDLCVIEYSVKSIDYTGRLSLLPLIEIHAVCKEDPTGEKVWNILRSGIGNDCAYLWTQTRLDDAQVCYAMTYSFLKNGAPCNAHPIRIEKERQVGFSIGTDVKPGDTVKLIKYIVIASSMQHERNKLLDHAVEEAVQIKSIGVDVLKHEQQQAWQLLWNEMDVQIEGDPAAQQGIRYNIFQLCQTYRGDDARLNIAPKGFTGEKYGGNTYWNTELCCVPFFLEATPYPIAENLLMYRYRQLPQAIENARKLGFKEGAALYPQVTYNGEECHNEWEITFEEIHRNSIMIHAIVQHALLTGSNAYIARYGLEVMIAVSRFWGQRVSFSQPKQKYVILGVTGPDEYENNVDNNWYTNYSCVKCLKTTLHYIELVAEQYPDDYARIRRVTNLQLQREATRWRDIIDRMYLPVDHKRGIFVQNDGYLDKELQTVDAIPPHERPINQHWSWDRILRSCYIKQSDVLLGLYLNPTDFNAETVRRNFDFYEPMTVHESSLSPHIHAILAARIGYVEKAYRLFLHATRLDLDDYNNETREGLHITSMAGSRLAIVRGFAGMQVRNNMLCFDPVIPNRWSSYAFKVHFRGRTIGIHVDKRDTRVTLLSGEPIRIRIKEEEKEIG
ncbi:MAG: family 65 glycosyl hydrolase [Prevotellaceae bacterium]|jgi:maltose phosphorylase|nr:family 65 glycosyl hydrolase [Prevotellaceae bacterium]